MELISDNGEEIYSRFYEILKVAKKKKELKKAYKEEKSKLRQDLESAKSKEEDSEIRRKNFLLNKAYKELGGKIYGQMYEDISWIIIIVLLLSI